MLSPPAVLTPGALEAVLSTLLPSFTYELPKEDIIWNIASVCYPTMGTGARSQMFLKVTPLRRSVQGPEPPRCV